MDRSLQRQLASNGLLQRLDAWSDGSGPLYRRLANALRTAISRGDLTVGELLPPERILARQLSVSRSTVVAAYELLQDERLLERRQGSGTRICSAPPRRGNGLASTLNRNTLFRRITDGPGGTIDLTGAYLLEPGGLPQAALEGIEDEMLRLSETSGYSPLGYLPLREAISLHLSHRGVSTSPEQVLVTAGAQQAIYMTACLFLQRGDSVLVENPTYPGALDAFSAVGARLVGLRTRRHGVDLPAIAEHIGRVEPRLMYLIPTYQNPVGGVLGEQARRSLAEL